MHVKIEDFKTGWFGLSMGVKKEEIEELTKALENLKQKNNHFHMRSSFEGSGGVGDIEFYIQNEDEVDNIVLDVSQAIFPENNETP